LSGKSTDFDDVDAYIINLKIIIEYLTLNKENNLFSSMFNCNIHDFSQQLSVLSSQLSTTRLVDPCITIQELFQESIEYGICEELLFGAEMIWGVNIAICKK
jgi:hypothetical protein